MALTKKTMKRSSFQKRLNAFKKQMKKELDEKIKKEIKYSGSGFEK